MGIEDILVQIDAEIEKLTEVRNLLAGTGKLTAGIKDASVKKHSFNLKKKRVLSPAARKRIADAQRRRWAAHRAKAKAK
jgi:hypothetical protein